MPTIQRFQSVLSDFGQRLPLTHQGDFQNDSVMTAMAKLEWTIKSGRQVNGFSIEILLPGASLDNGDSGIGAIGRIDHARVTPGTVIHMHPHKDDEILTYLPPGADHTS